MDAGKVLVDAGIDQRAIADRDAQLPSQGLVKLIKQIEEQSADAAENLAMGAYGVVDFIVSNAPTLGEGLKQLADYLRLLTEMPALDYEELGELAWLRANVATDEPAVERFMVEFTFACVVTRSRPYLPATFAPQEVHLHYPQHGSDTELRRIFPSRIRCRRPVNALVYTLEVVRQPVARGGAPLAAILERVGNEMLARLPVADETSGEMRRVLKDLFTHG